MAGAMCDSQKLHQTREEGPLLCRSGTWANRHSLLARSYVTVAEQQKHQRSLGKFCLQSSVILAR